MELATIIIVNWNGNEVLKHCLKSLKRQTFQKFKVIIIDNGSEDDSLISAKNIYPTAKIISLPFNYGFAAGNNFGLKIVDTPYTALLNNDTVVEKNWLKALMSALESTPLAGFAASRMLFYEQSCTIDRAGDSYCRSGTAFLRGRGFPADAYRKREWVFGACAGAALYRTSMLKKIGFFDEDFFLLYEDVDLSFRAQLRGYKCLYVPEAIVYHHGSKSIGFDTETSIYYSHRNLEWVYFQNMPAKLIFRSIANHVLYNFMAIIFFASKGHFTTIIKAKIDAFRGIKKSLKKRKTIQSFKIVNDDYLWHLMEKENITDRIKRRFKNISE
jgi:hypothetical protein